jgi:hypothetical protein
MTTPPTLAPKALPRPDPVIVDSDEWREYLNNQMELARFDSANRGDDELPLIPDFSDFGGM